MRRPPWHLHPQARALAWIACLSLTAHLSTASAAAALDLATGLQAGVGIAFDEVNHHLYFVEFTTGTLKRIVLTPVCDNPAATPGTCTLQTVATGLTHAQDVAVDPAAGVAYVTTRDFPAGTSGALYEVDLATGTPSLVTFNLGAPRQIVLDVPTHSAWVVGHTGGKVWRIDLTTGAKTAVITGLQRPVGLAVSANRARAYVTERGPVSPAPADIRLSEFDLATGSFLRVLVSGASTSPAGGLTAPFYLRWSDPSGGALYVVEHDPANRASRADLVAGATLVALPGLPFRPSSIAVNIPGGAVYVATDTSVVRVELVTVPASQPVFLSVGWIVPTDIDASGYAALTSAFPHAPFGGVLDLFGNLSKFWGWGARSYVVEVDAGSGFTPVVVPGWTVDKYNVLTNDWEPRNVTVDSNGRYPIPPEYDPTNYAGYLWAPAKLALKWPTGADGVYSFRFRLFDAAGNPVTIPASEVNLLTLRVDNSAPEVELEDVLQVMPSGPDAVVAPCQIVSTPPNTKFKFRITARDPNQHFLGYRLYGLWGDNGSDDSIAGDTYSPGHVDEDGAYLWSGVSNEVVPAAGWAPTCNCAHTFILEASKRTTNGYWYLLSATYHQSITINNVTSPVCP